MEFSAPSLRIQTEVKITETNMSSRTGRATAVRGVKHSFLFLLTESRKNDVSSENKDTLPNRTQQNPLLMKEPQQNQVGEKHKQQSK